MVTLHLTSSAQAKETLLSGRFAALTLSNVDRHISYDLDYLEKHSDKDSTCFRITVIMINTPSRFAVLTLSNVDRHISYVMVDLNYLVIV